MDVHSNFIIRGGHSSSDAIRALIYVLINILNRLYSYADLDITK